jgi:N-acetylmuramic acid 6-phosphate etherase
MCDGLELPGTFGLDYGQIKILAPGGISNDRPLKGLAEDDITIAQKDFDGANLTKDDNMIVLSASGSTPYAVEMLKLAKTKGLFTIAIANNDNTPILKLADIAIYLPTPSEIIVGSTRMGAGTSQKIAINLLSTLMAIYLGHVYDGMMVNVIADNKKLKQRAVRIVSTITGCDENKASACLELTGGRVKSAVLIASGTGDYKEANQLLLKHRGNLRAALSDLTKDL